MTEFEAETYYFMGACENVAAAEFAQQPNKSSPDFYFADKRE